MPPPGDDRVPLRPTDTTLLVRTSFDDDTRWASLCRVVATPTVEGFLAGLDIVDDAAHAGLGPADLRELWPDGYQGPHFFLVADAVAIEQQEHPILVVSVPYTDPSLAWLNGVPRPPFRVVAASLWSVENNLSTGNMDWRDFADVSVDEAFRGF